MTKLTEESAGDLLPQGRVPDFFIVGHPKSGTTALYEMLRRHPQIYMPVKEPWYFAPELRAGSGAAAAQPNTLAEYLSLFDEVKSGQLIGEASPSYLRSRDAASRIAQSRPDARIIAILREPADFLRSFHLQCVQSYIEVEKDFGKAIALEGARRRGQSVPRRSARPEALFYSEHVRYVEQLRRYHRVFAMDQVMIIIYDDFRRANDATVREVLRFLAVDHTASVEVMDANPTVRLRSRTVSDLLRAISVGEGPASRTLRAAIKTATPSELRRTALRTTRRRLAYGRPREPDEEIVRDLRHRFKGEVVALSEYLDRDLVRLWGYDTFD